MRAWIFQDAKQKAKHGRRSARGRSVGTTSERSDAARSLAPRQPRRAYAKKLEGMAAAGLLQPYEKITWAAFVERFAKTHLANLRPSTQAIYAHSLGHFTRLVAPKYLDAVKAKTVDEFAAARLAEGVETATVNRDLRHVRCALNKAKRWDLIPKRIIVEMLKEPERDKDFIDDDAFARLYAAAESMRYPAGQHYSPAEWWRALLVVAYTTGWRIGEILALRKDQVDFATGEARLDAADTKGGRDVRINLPAVTLDHLRTVISFDDVVFRWPLRYDGLWEHFRKLKAEAGVEVEGAFHNLRRGFANANVDEFNEDVLQQLMRHKDRQTTRRYVHQAKQLRRQKTGERVHVPAILAEGA